jgi:hypothetical protein
MAEMQKHIKIDGSVVYDPELIYSRVMGLQQSRNINIQDILSYEMSPMPASLFNEDGDMRSMKSKSVLMNKLQVSHSERFTPNAQATIIDACAILWVLRWPKIGTVSDYAAIFMKFLINKLKCSDVYVVFDRYQDYSIKERTRASRAGNDHGSHHQLSFTHLYLHRKLPLQ